MQIPRDLPQFNSDRTLLLVLGALQGKGYLCENGQLEEVFSYAQPTPSYSDNEGFFVRSGKGMVYGTGSVREDDRNEQGKRFAIAMAEKIATIDKATPLVHIDLCSPTRTTGTIEERLNPDLRSKIRKRSDTQLTKEHPLEVLKALDKTDPYQDS